MRRLAAALAATLLLASCRVDTTLGVRVHDDGSGVVTARFRLDREAVDTLGGKLRDVLRVADLEQAGWKIDVRQREDGAEVTATKTFQTAAQLTSVVHELSGDAGPFRDFRVQRTRSRLRTRWRFSGSVDLQKGVAGTAIDPGDATLRARLGREGVDEAQLRDFLNKQIDRVFSVQVVVELPGRGNSNAPRSVGGQSVWKPAVGEQVQLRASASKLDATRVGLVAAGVALAALAAGVMVWHRRNRGLARRSPPALPEGL